MSTPPERPRPSRTDLTAPFWDAAAAGQLVVQRCLNCGELRHYPRPMCPACYGTQAEWCPLSGRGEIYSYTVAHQAFHPFWADRVPYVIATIELEEGVRMVSEMPSLTPDTVAIGLAVEVGFEPIGDGLHLPVFRTVSSENTWG
jgi:uncharacterized OB-fold protein